jgi:methionine synthase II (cobalamin-independent)
MAVTKDIEIEELIEQVPAAVNYLSKKGIRCIMCGEPIWGTLEEAAKEKGFSDEEIEGFVREINELAKESDLPRKGSFTKDIRTMDNAGTE